MATKTYLLDPEDFLDFQLYGMVSSYSDSPQLVFHVNLNFETQFSRVSDLELVIENQKLYFPRFEWTDQQNHIYYNLIKNVSYSLDVQEKPTDLTALFEMTPHLISQFKMYNYFLKITAEEDQIELPIKENLFIQKISKLDINKIKTIDRLVY
ncbi:MAG: IPExxxVDY family protein [Weeksellaceae bacterium]